MKMDCEVARENIDAYALGVLDRDEAAALEAHVAQCRECASLLDEARERAALIGLSAPLVPASAALKARVMASATVLSSEKFRRRPSASWWTAAAAALVIVTAGALAWGAVMQRRASDLRHDRAVAQAEAQQSLQQLASLTAWQDGMLRISAQPDLRTTAMVGTAQAPGAQGRYLWSSSEQAGAFFASGLPALEQGQSYTFWFVYDDKWENAGTCTAQAGEARLIVRPEASAADGPPKGFAVTVEPSGETTERTGPMVLQGGLN